MEGWIINVSIAATGVISTFAILRQKVSDSLVRDTEQDMRFREFKDKVDTELQDLNKFKNESKPHLEHLSRLEQAMTKKLENATQEITKLNQQVTQSPTMKEVREEFVTKEMYKQLEKHIDEKFTRLEIALDKTHIMLQQLLTELKDKK